MRQIFSNVSMVIDGFFRQLVVVLLSLHSRHQSRKQPGGVASEHLACFLLIQFVTRLDLATARDREISPQLEIVRAEQHLA
jgi:hypothetical protein